MWHKNIGKLSWSESVNGRKTGPRQLSPFADAGKVRIEMEIAAYVFKLKTIFG